MPIIYESLPRFCRWHQGGVNLGLPGGHAGGADMGQSWEGPRDLRGVGMKGRVWWNFTTRKLQETQPGGEGAKSNNG